jgi:plasmid stabilization system protein ParE
MKLRFTPRATQDLVDIADYVRAHNPAAAQRVRAAILASLQSLIRHPYIGREQTLAGVRKLVTRRYPYLVYFTVEAATEEIVVLAIQHPARAREHEDL